MIKKVLKSAKALFVIFGLLAAGSAAAVCPNMPSGVDIDYWHPKTTVRELCRIRYVSFFDTYKQSPLAVVEQISSFDLAGKTFRYKTFLRDHDIPEKDQPSYHDFTIAKNYLASVDKGHLAASANYRNPEEIKQTNLFTNIAVQNSSLNRGAWSHLEENIRKRIKNSTDTFTIITGTGYNDCNSYAITGGDSGESFVAVPDYFWKILVNQRTREVNAWIANNYHEKTSRNPHIRVKPTTLEQISKVTCELKIKIYRKGQ